MLMRRAILRYPILLMLFVLSGVFVACSPSGAPTPQEMKDGGWQASPPPRK